jgi:hypothetical protein
MSSDIAKLKSRPVGQPSLSGHALPINGNAERPMQNARRHVYGRQDSRGHRAHQGSSHEARPIQSGDNRQAPPVQTAHQDHSCADQWRHGLDDEAQKVLAALSALDGLR